MRKEEFFEVLGELDGDLVDGAKPAARRERGKGPIWVKWGALAACLVLTVSLMGFVAEAGEYGAAVTFFDENGLSTQGLSRSEVRAVYRDITSRHFTNDKTAEVIARTVPGLELDQRQPTPEELAALWDRNVWANGRPGAGISYRIEIREKLDETLGFDVLDRSVLECYQDGELIWRAEFPDFVVEGSAFTADGTAVWGHSDTWSSQQPTYSWLARVDGAGNTLWQHQLEHGFAHESLSHVLDNGDGTWAVISRGDFRYLCLSQYDSAGDELSFRRTEVGNRGVWNAVRLGDGYLVQLGHRLDGETARVVKLDREGTLLDTFNYEGEDCDYTITGMIEFGGRMYLSAYAVPKRTNEGGQNEIAGILEHVFARENWEISSQELTYLVRDNYTAVLLLCGPEGGAPETFYSVRGSLGGELAVNDAGELAWEVESVVNTFFSPATSSFSIGGTCQVFRYTFDDAGTLLRQEDTGETVPYRR